MHTKIDTLHSVEIPEGVDLQAELAGLIPRALAFTIDFAFRAAVVIILLIIASFFDKVGEGLWLIVLFLMEWLYPVFFELFWKGQTPGKRMFDIKVVMEDLVPIKLQASLIRNLLRVADFLPLFYIFGICSLILSNKFQRLGDLAAGTLVIYKPQALKIYQDDITVAPIAPQLPLTEDQQVAIVEFAQNRGKLSSARQQEIAELLTNIIPKKNTDKVAYLQGVGKWLLGGK